MPGWTEAIKGISIKVTELKLVNEDWSATMQIDWNIVYPDKEEPEAVQPETEEKSDPKTPEQTPVVPIVPSVPTDKKPDPNSQSSDDKSSGD